MLPLLLHNCLYKGHFCCCWLPRIITLLPLKSQVIKFYHQLAQYLEELDVFFILGVYEKFDKVFFLFLFFWGWVGEGGCKLIIYSLMSAKWLVDYKYLFRTTSSEIYPVKALMLMILHVVL